ncbi:carboxypeptidase-like regulatory domain-containing protein [Pyxidicoccus trucidator]|uniref:carboxypeptidase-like regulatory domain-containing protein n=1 Tax=Pyxidicoccus trucidator TaxID=2709662 RepID=UPI0013D9C20B|nr:carboxypeptidase-like regulatory domain-containing protein [Pyxidicoccus trucidator]
MLLHQRLREGQREYLLLALHDPLPEGCQALEAGRGWTLERRLRQLAQDESNLRTLSTLVQVHGALGRHALRTSEDVVKQAATLLSFGHLRLALAPPPERYGAPAFPEEVPKQEPPVTPQEDLTLRLQVVDDVSDGPISGIKLRILLADDTEKEATTDADGNVTLEKVPKGTFNVLSVVDDATLSNSVALVRTGGPWSGQKPSKAGTKSKATSQRVLVKVTEHRVIDGESLDSVAEMYGLTEDALAQFNWGTTDADKVQQRLAVSVGCTLKDKAGKLVFSRDDDPGILYVPRPVAMTGLAVEQSHILRVGRARKPQPFSFSV